MTCERSVGPTATVTRTSSRSTASLGESSPMETTLTSLSSCMITCSRGADSTSTTIVMRLKCSSSSVGATASE